MRVVTILGSPRASGNTSHVLNWVEQTLRSEAHSVERITLIEHRLDPCRECANCRKSTEGQCTNADDAANGIMQKIVKADVLLLATPLFCWGFPSHMKALLDRMYCLVGDYENNPEYSSKLERKPMGLLITCAGPEEGNAELLIRSFYALVHFMKARPMGHVLFPFFRKLDDLTVYDHTRATDFALRIVAGD